MLDNSNIGIELRADGARCDNIRVTGFGCDITNFYTQSYCLQSSVTGTSACYFSNCEAYGSGIHLYGHLNSIEKGFNGTGGIAVFENIIAGGGLGGPGVGVSYANNGQYEAYFEGCIASSGPVPNTYAWEGMSIYGHTSGDGSPFNLVVARGCVTKSGPYMCNKGVSFGNTPAAATLADVRTFIIDEVMELPPTGIVSKSAFLPRSAYVGCRLHFRMEDAGLSYAERGAGNGTAYLPGGTAQGGWLINCFTEIDCSTMRIDQNNWIALCQSESDNRICINSHFRWRLPLNTRGMWHWYTEYSNNPAYGTQNVLVNCIWERDINMKGSLGVAANNSSTNLKNNAFYGVDTGTSSGIRGYDQDAGRFVPVSNVGTFPVAYCGQFAPLSPYSTLAALGTAYTGVPDQDIFHRPRPRATAVSIGPVDVSYPRSSQKVIE